MDGSKTQSRWWWFDRQSNSPRRSRWLQSTLADLDKKTKEMLKLVEEDADSFAQRAEMYYRKRPQLINMIEDFYRDHRSLAEQYDQVKSDPTARLMTAWPSSPLSFKCQTEKLSSMEKSYDSYSDTYDHEESGESEVDDPVQEDEPQVDGEKEEEISSRFDNDEVIKLRKEIQILQKENEIQKEQLMQKDEEKREVIRQLSSTVDVLKEENTKLRKHMAKSSPKKSISPEFNKLKAVFMGKLFDGSPKSRVVAL